MNTNDPHADMLARAEADRMRDAREREEAGIDAALVAFYSKPYYGQNGLGHEAMRAAIDAYTEIAPRWQMAYRAGAKKMREMAADAAFNAPFGALAAVDAIRALPLPGKAPPSEPKDYDHA